MLLAPAVLAIAEQMKFFEGLHTRDVVDEAHISHTHATRKFGGPGAVELAENFLDLVNILLRGLDMNSLRVGTVVWAAIVDSDESARDFDADLLGQFLAKFLAVGLAGRI
jgi:hypothetical protein